MNIKIKKQWWITLLLLAINHHAFSWTVTHEGLFNDDNDVYYKYDKKTGNPISVHTIHDKQPENSIISELSEVKNQPSEIQKNIAQDDKKPEYSISVDTTDDKQQDSLIDVDILYWNLGAKWNDQEVHIDLLINLITNFKESLKRLKKKPSLYILDGLTITSKNVLAKTVSMIYQEIMISHHGYEFAKKSFDKMEELYKATEDKDSITKKIFMNQNILFISVNEDNDIIAPITQSCDIFSDGKKNNPSLYFSILQYKTGNDFLVNIGIKSIFDHHTLLTIDETSESYRDLWASCNAHYKQEMDSLRNGYPFTVLFHAPTNTLKKEMTSDLKVRVANNPINDFHPERNRLAREYAYNFGLDQSIPARMTGYGSYPKKTTNSPLKVAFKVLNFTSKQPMYSSYLSWYSDLLPKWSGEYNHYTAFDPQLITFTYRTQDLEKAVKPGKELPEN
ncbi:hypothetical protein ACH42_04525 [Endozoicomonas sp. (ex Bugula neritina AB1)]|nr:hypothetical protein ACH42_04525 [Endozoicomonas sp. (ex Bugula neritina AB1)]